MESEDLAIPAPWGHIAVKLYGNKENTPVLVIHGILDNVGSFERILKLLPKDYYYICIDLPGHGRSSHWPEFSVINTLDNLLVYKLVVDYFDRKKYVLLGHSYGAQLGFIFTQVYPQFITKMIMLDTVFMYPTPTKYLKSYLIEFHDTYFTMMKKLKSNRQPEYTYEEALMRLMMNRRYGEISQEAAEPLLKRMMIPLENGKLKLTLDQRLKFFVNPPIDFRYISDFIKKNPVLCPTLIILASESEAHHIHFTRIINQLKSYKNIKIKIVQGNHDVHNVHPERVAPFINDFLSSNQLPKSKL